MVDNLHVGFAEGTHIPHIVFVSVMICLLNLRYESFGRNALLRGFKEFIKFFAEIREEDYPSKAPSVEAHVIRILPQCSKFYFQRCRVLGGLGSQ